jgi:hypothetical protein
LHGLERPALYEREGRWFSGGDAFGKIRQRPLSLSR